MARPPRIQIAGGIYHVISRGIRGMPIFLDFLDFDRFLGLLETTDEEYGWRVHGYCLMTNHYHLIVRTPEPNISDCMHYVNTLHAKRFNRRYGFQGHLFQRRFHSVVVKDTSQLLTVHRYVVLNPVRARMCSDPAQWPWSSYRAAAGLETPRRFLDLEHLERYFGPVRARAHERFRAFVADGVDAIQAAQSADDSARR